MKYIISGISPGLGGVGKLLEFLRDNLDDKKFTIICPNLSSLKNKYLRKISNQFSIKIIFRFKLIFIKGKDIILMHHQTIGLKQTKRLINSNKTINFYLMDNSFFCVKSYNHLEGQKTECLKCIGGNFQSVLDYGCKSFPTNYNVKENIEFLKFLKVKSNEINFYTLSPSNAKLVKKHFGDNTFVKPIYFLTNDILLRDQTLNSNSLTHYDIVFHGHDIEVKGFLYIQELATLLHEYKFLIPSFNNKIKMDNVDSKFITWETGLKEAVINSKLILTPSFWSNTPEASTLKSFLYNGSVGLIKNQYGFANDINKDSYLALSGNPSEDAAIIDIFIKEENHLKYKQRGKKYIYDYISKSSKSMTELFDFKKNI
jgi:hypothetical protein